MSRYFNTFAIVINHRRYQESDQVLTLLTPARGKIMVTAKGISSSNSRRRGSLELGNVIKTQIYEKNNRYWLTDTTVVNHTLSTDKSLIQLNLLFYFLEIINNFIAENQQIDGVYEILQSLIESINQNNFPHLIDHEISLLKMLGFGVPPIIIISHQHKDYSECQKQIKLFLESIIEKPLRSSKLFN
jgi:DNA repair protein RecO